MSTQLQSRMDEERAATPRYEYTVSGAYSGELMVELNSLATEGWRVVSVLVKSRCEEDGSAFYTIVGEREKGRR